MKRAELITIEWSSINGLVVIFLGINDRHLFSINSSWGDFFHFKFVIYTF